MAAFPPSTSEFPLVKSRGRRRWENIDDQRRTLFRVKSNQIRLIRGLGYEIPDSERLIIEPRTYEGENSFYTYTFVNSMIPEMQRYHLDLIRTGREKEPSGGIYSDRFIMGRQYYKYDPNTTRTTDLFIVIYIEDDEKEAAIPLSTINTHIAEITNRFRTITEKLHLLYVLPKPVIRTGRADIIKGGSFEIIVLEDSQLYANAVDHILNQTYISLNDETTENIMKNLRKSKTSLSKINITDPNSVINGWKENKVIMVVRRDILTGGPELSIQYRVVNISAQDMIKRM